MASQHQIDVPHVFLVSFPGQGHINPMLRLGKKLAAAAGLLVTFSTTSHLAQDMITAGSIPSDHRRPTPLGCGFLRFEFFDDSRSESPSQSSSFTFEQYLPQLQRLGAASLKKILKDQTNQNLPPVSCLIGNPFVPWVCDVAADLGISCAVFWVQSAAVFSIYYHHFTGAVPFPSETQPKIDVELPFLPLLKHDEIPSFLLPGDEDNFGAIGKVILGQFRNLSTAFCVLIDSFEELEVEIVNDMSRIFPIRTVGPLFMKWGGEECADDHEIETKKISGDCLKSDECLEWLDSKPPGSVVYVSFGSVVYLKQQQVDEIAHGLNNSGLPFLWVLKPPPKPFHRHVVPDQDQVIRKN